MKAGWDEGEARSALGPWLITMFCFSYLTTASSAGLKALIRMFCFFWERLDVLSFAPLLGGASFLALVFIPLGPSLPRYFFFSIGHGFMRGLFTQMINLQELSGLYGRPTSCSSETPCMQLH
jgi:hypothetical protein